MLVVPAITLAVAGSALAGPVIGVKDSAWRRAAGPVVQRRDAPAIKSMLTSVGKLLGKGDTLLASYTAENSAEKSKEIMAFIKTANKELLSSAKTIEASKPLTGITSVITLMGPAKSLGTTFEAFGKTVKKQVPVLKATPEGPKVADSMMDLKPGSKALAKAMSKQIPESLIKQAGSALGGAGPPTPEQTDKLVDYGLESIVAQLKGEEMPPIPEGIPEPLAATIKGQLAKAGGASSGSDTKAPKAAPKGKAGAESGASSSSESAAKSPKAAPKAAPKKSSGADAASDEEAPKAPKSPKAPKAAPKAAPKKGSDADSTAAGAEAESPKAKAPKKGSDAAGASSTSGSASKSNSGGAESAGGSAKSKSGGAAGSAGAAKQQSNSAGKGSSG